MPEGHTIHRVARDHTHDFAGQKVRLSSPQGRFSEAAAELDGKQLKSVMAYGKHLCYEFTRGRMVHIHLGLYGKFRRHKSPPPEPRGAVRLRLIGKQRAFDLNGPNRCELITVQAWSAICGRLGPDPLRDDADSEKVWSRIRKSRQPIGKLLMDQSVIAGIGNVYRAEILFLMRIHPERPGNQITRDEFEHLWNLSVDLLKIGVRYNRIIVANPQDVGKPRSRMTRQERLLVYKKNVCVACDRHVERWDMAGRTAYACPRCQT